MGLHARRPRPHHRRRPGGPQLHRRRRRGRPLELPGRHPALDPGPGARAASSCSSSTTATSRRTRRSSITDWFAHTPPSGPGQELRRARGGLRRHPADVEHERYIFPAQVPGPLAADAWSPAPAPCRSSFSYRLLAQEPIAGAGRQVRIADSTNFPAATTIAAALVEVEPGGMRELHWHPNADEWQYYISRPGADDRVRRRAARRAPSTTRPGDVGYVPFAHGPLRREHRRRAAALPGDVPQRPLSPTSRSASGWR